ncbi:MAG TPA: hypothetical protein PK205_16755 [Promineifilum sp.]|nr:hypothetical protein [Promineifilum sp.]HRQ14954.1 hypothetical protein [Promineifilum sp.]
MQAKDELPIISFTDIEALHRWLETHHATSSGIWVRVYKKHSGVQSIRFEDLLEEGLCFGWSESLRVRGDEQSYLQMFTPRKTKGTTSERNLKLAEKLIAEGRMTSAGRVALGLGD